MVGFSSNRTSGRTYSAPEIPVPATARRTGSLMSSALSNYMGYSPLLNNMGYSPQESPVFEKAKKREGPENPYREDVEAAAQTGIEKNLARLRSKLAGAGHNITSTERAQEEAETAARGAGETAGRGLQRYEIERDRQFQAPVAQRQYTLAPMTAGMGVVDALNRLRKKYGPRPSVTKGRRGFDIGIKYGG